MPRDEHRETITTLRATHTAHRVAMEVGHPHLESSTPQPVIPNDNTIPYESRVLIERTAKPWKIWSAIMLFANAAVIWIIATSK